MSFVFAISNMKYRPFSKGDFESYFLFAGNAEVMKLITGYALTREEAQAKFSKILAHNNASGPYGYHLITLRETGEMIGYSKFTQTAEGEAEIGYCLLPEYWGRGFGYEISAGLVEFSKSVPGLNSLIAIIDPANIPSGKILLKCGFSLFEAGEMDGLPSEVYKRTI